MATKNSNSHLYRDVYWEHVTISRRYIQDEVNAGRACQVAANRTGWLMELRRKTLDRMRDWEVAALLRELKMRKYGDYAGPGWSWLCDAASREGVEDGEQQCRWIVDWILRTHGPPTDAKNRWYKAVLKPTDRFKQVKAAKLHWRKTDQIETPWQCVLNDEQFTIRLGDFPIEHLYEVFSADSELGVTDDWPTTWAREPWLVRVRPVGAAE